MMEVAMTTIALGFSAAVSLRHALVAFGRALARGARRVAQGMENRRAAQALARLDEHMLADIGLTRGDLHDAYAGSIWSDPTALLRARALERRLARRGISHGFEFASSPPLAPKIDAKAASQVSQSACGCG
jgi:uncharacterized protein YjiS (DUF1127 family)